MPVRAGRRRQRGVTLVEALAVLFIAALMLIGLAMQTNTSMQEIRDMSAAQYQSQLAGAAAQLMQANYTTLAATASTTTPVVISLTASSPNLSSYLSGSTQAQNAYGQSPCLLVYKTAGGGLDGRLVTEGGQTISDLDLGYIAANSGQGGGSIPTNNNGAGSAYGAYGAWKITTPNPAAAKCSAQATGGGHLVSEVFNNGPNGLVADFLYRDPIAGFPQANQMNTPIYLADQTHTATTSDAACGSGVPGSVGKITADTSGRVLACVNDGSNVYWKYQGSMYWLDPVSDVSNLPGIVGAQQGDVSLVLDTGIPYEYTGSSWHSLIVDNSGNLNIGSGTLVGGKLDLTVQNVVGAACAADPIAPSAQQLSMDSQGRVLTCQSGTWQLQNEIDPGPIDTNCRIIMGPSPSPDYPGCGFSYSGTYPSGSNPTYNGATGTYTYVEQRTVTLTKPGIIVASTWAHMYDAQCIAGSMNNGYSGQLEQILEIVNNDTNAIIGTNLAQSPTLKDDSSGINETLTQAASPNTNGYTVYISTNWANFTGPNSPSQGSPPFPAYSSSFCGPSGNVVTTSPIVAGWTINTYY